MKCMGCGELAVVREFVEEEFGYDGGVYVARLKARVPSDRCTKCGRITTPISATVKKQQAIIEYLESEIRFLKPERE